MFRGADTVTEHLDSTRRPANPESPDVEALRDFIEGIYPGLTADPATQAEDVSDTFAVEDVDGVPSHMITMNSTELTNCPPRKDRP